MATFAFAFVAGLVLTALAIPALRSLGVVDRPNARSSHQRPTVRGGGVAILVAASLIAAFSVGPVVAWWFALAPICLGVLGFRDDLKSLGAKFRFLVQIGLGLLGAISWFWLTRASSATTTLLLPVALIVATFFVVGYVNAFNFMDGVNGISGLQTMVVGLTIAYLGRDEGPLLGLSLAIAGAAAGFLPFNIVNAKVFLGDVGSYFIGGWLAGLFICALRVGVDPFAACCPFLIYVTDTFTTLVRRVVARKRWWEAHREHVYQRLTDYKFTHLGSAGITTALTAACGALGALSAETDSLALKNVLRLGAISVAAGYAMLPKIVAATR